MEQFIENLRNLLATSDPKDFRVKSVTGPDGVTTSYASYEDLLGAYIQAINVNAQTTANVYRPIRLGRGDRGGY